MTSAFIYIVNFTDEKFAVDFSFERNVLNGIKVSDKGINYDIF